MSLVYSASPMSSQVNGYAESFHDSLLLYVKALSATIKQGGSPLNGRAISQNMRNISFDGELKKPQSRQTTTRDISSYGYVR